MSANILAKICTVISTHGEDAAREILAAEYPFVPIEKPRSSYDARKAMEVYVRDGFICRYSGKRLVFYGTLRLLSAMMPDAFPFHPNSKADACHSAYWTEYPSIDHIIPLGRGGKDEPFNWITTSMGRNIAKGNWTPAEAGWPIFPPGKFSEWDGLTRWFLSQPQPQIDQIQGQAIKKWHKAAREVIYRFDQGKLEVPAIRIPHPWL